MFGFLFIALIPTVAFALDVSPCQLQNAQLPQNVEISGCEKQPCDLVRGTDMTMTFTHTADFDIKNPQAKVMATAFGITTKYDLPEDRASVCDNLDFGICPIEKDDDFTYHLDMPVLKMYPLTKLVLEISIFDEGSKKTVSCFRMNCQTVDK